jgi:hypothetical protein
MNKIEEKECNDKGRGHIGMKIAILTYINLMVLIFIPGFGIAQDGKHDDRAINQQEAGKVSADGALIALNAYYAQSEYMAEPDLSPGTRHTAVVDPGIAGIIGSWRERVFNSLKAYYGPVQQDQIHDSRLLTNSEFDDQANDSSVVAKLVLKETFKYAQERVPEIDRLVKALKFEISTEDGANKDAGAAAQDQASVKESEAKRIAKKKDDDDKLFVKTGLHIPIEGGKPTLVSETVARYHKLSSFIKVKLDGQYDNSLGVTYLLGKDVHLQAERQVTHVAATANLNLLQLVYTF